MLNIPFCSCNKIIPDLIAHVNDKKGTGMGFALDIMQKNNKKSCP